MAALGDFPLLWSWDSDQPVLEGLVGCGGNEKAVWYLVGGHWVPLSILQHEITRQFCYSSCK